MQNYPNLCTQIEKENFDVNYINSLKNKSIAYLDKLEFKSKEDNDMIFGGKIKKKVKTN